MLWYSLALGGLVVALTASLTAIALRRATVAKDGAQLDARLRSAGSMDPQLTPHRRGDP